MTVSTAISTASSAESRDGTNTGAKINAARTRPVPVDFEQVAKGRGVRALARHYRTSQTAVIRWFRESGVERTPRAMRAGKIPADLSERAQAMGITALTSYYNAARPTVIAWLASLGISAKGRDGGAVPDDLAAQARAMTRIQLATHYQVGETTIRRWLAEIDITPLDPRTMPAPEDFVEVAATMTRRELRDHYSRGAETIARWIRETGAKPLMPRPRSAPHYTRPPLRYVRQPGHSNVAAIKSNYTAEDHAADTLRRFGPVYRCDERGRPDLKGKRWRVGNVVLTGAELIARAGRKVAA